MKKAKKLTSLALALTMAGAMLPGTVSTVSAEGYDVGMSNISSVTLSNFEDFEGFGEAGVEGVTLFTGTATEKTYNLGDYITLTISGSENKAEIVKDPVTDSYALKITHSGTEGGVAVSNWFKANKQNLSATATAHAGYKARFEHYAADTWLQRFNAFVNVNDWYGIARIMGYGDDLYLDGIRTFASGLTTNYSEKYLESDMYYNSYNKSRIISTESSSFEHVGNNVNPMARALFNITTATGAANANYYGKGSADEPTVIWLDDIYFETIDYKVKEAYVGGIVDDGTTMTNVPLNAPINVKMSGEISPACLNGDYITLTDSAGAMVDFSVEKDADSNFTVYPKGQKVSETYTLTVKAGTKSTLNNAVATTVDKTIKYTTCADGLAFIRYIENLSFDNLTEQSFSSAGAGTFLAGKIQVHANQEGDSVSVATDPVTGSKALKLTRAKENLNGGMSKYNYIFNPVIESGKVTVNFDVRMDCDNGSANSFISFSDSNATGYSASWANRLRDNFWWKKADGTEQWTNFAKWDHNVYFPAMMSVDLVTDTFRGQVYRRYGEADQQVIDTSWAFEQSEANNTSNIGYMNIVDFRSNAVGTTTEEINIYIDNLKIAYYDYRELAVDKISKTQEKADIDGEIVLTMNAEVADECVTTANFMLMDTDGNPVEGYTVTKNGNDVIIKAPADLSYETGYFVSVKSGITAAMSGVLPMENFYTFSFTTAAWSPYVYEDNFEGFEVGKRWEGPNTVTIGNATVTLEAGDSIEYAVDEATGKVGFKLVKGTATGNLDFKYIFPNGFVNGKYRVYVDSRIENWSKAHNRWPALLNGSGKDNIGAGNRVTGSYWLEKSGNFRAQDRFGFDWGKWETENNTDSGRWISGYDMNSNYKVIGELTTGAGYNYGLENVETGVSVMGKIEPATEEATLGGVLMRMNGSATDWANAIYQGTQNPGEDGVAWIYGIAVEKMSLKVTGSSVESALDAFDPAEDVTVSFNDRVASSKVNNNTVKLYKADTLVEDVTVTVSEDMKTVTITPAEGFLYNTEYKIVVDGVECYDAVAGVAEAKTFTFKTLKKTGFEIDDIELVEGGIVTTLYNNCDDNQKFITIGVAKDATGKITEIKFGDSGYVQANSNTNIAVEFESAAASYELYVWDGIDTMKPLVKKN